MKVVIFVCSFASAALVVAGAPVANNGADERVMFVPQQQYRARRSHYPAATAYASPCGASLPAIAPAPAYISPVHGGYGYGGGSYGGGSYGAGGHGYGYGPHYRAEELEDVMSFSDMEQGMSEHVPMARYGGYGATPVIHGGAGLAGLSGQLVQAVAPGPAFGVFPNANTGGCNVPLLLSCSPSIVPGRLVKSHGYGGYGSALPAAGASPSYRSSEDQNMEHEENAEETPRENLEPAEDNSHTSTR